MNPSKKKTGAMMFYLLLLSVVPSCYYTFTRKDLQANRLYQLLFHAVSAERVALFVVLLSAALAGVMLVTRVVVSKVDAKDKLRRSVQIPAVLTAVALVFLLSSSRLMKGLFYPGYYKESLTAVYAVSPFVFCLFTAVMAGVFVLDIQQVLPSFVYSFAVWGVSLLLGQVMDGHKTLYNAVYYLALFGNAYLVLRSACGISLRKIVKKLWEWFIAHKYLPLLPIAALCVGFAIESVRSRLIAGPFEPVKWFFFTAAVLSVLGCIVLYRRNKENFTERAFLLIAMVLGLYMCVFIPVTTLVTWDDEIHYAHALWMAQGDSWSLTDASLINREVAKIFSSVHVRPVLQHMVDEQSMIAESAPVLGATVLPYQAVGYLPHFLGILLGQILNMPYWITFILGRVGSLSFYAAVMYLSMKQMKSGKLLLAVIALIPTNMFQACSYSYDSWIVCLVAFGLSWFVGTLQRHDEKLTGKDVVIMLAALVLAIAPKGVYFPIILLLQLMPKEKFETQQTYRRYLLTVFAAAAACFIVYMVCPLFAGKYLGDTRGGSDVNSVQQIIYMLTNPITFAKTLWNFMAGYLSPENAYLYTSNMAYLNGKDFHTIVFTLMAVAAAIDHNQYDGIYDTLKVKLWSTAVLLITACAIAAVLYISFTPVGADTVLGCQPRYLAPMLFPFFMLVGNFCRIENWKHKRLACVMLVLAGYVCFSSIWANVVNVYVL